MVFGIMKTMKPFDAQKCLESVKNWEQEWNRTLTPFNENPVGNEIKVAREMFKKYEDYPERWIDIPKRLAF